MRADADDEKIVIGAQPQCLERPSVATHVRLHARWSKKREVRPVQTSAFEVDVGGVQMQDAPPGLLVAEQHSAAG
jgi:hypothetical protein